MHFKSFFKGSFFALFLSLFALTAASLVFQVNNEVVIARSITPSPKLVYIASQTQTHPFAAVLAAETIKDTNILLLGLDSRKGDKSARCDAIHMLSFKPTENKIVITTVPRGTAINIPNTAPETSYISNACSIMGFDWAKTQIEKITGVKADYVVKVGFSQVLGALRLAGLPTTPTLQFLRDRKDYLIGDYQRSYNQANFLRDMFLNNFEKLSSLPEPVQYLGYKLADTDMTFDQAKVLLAEVKRSGIKDVEIEVKPKDYAKRQEIHFDQNDTEWQYEQEYQSYQKDMISYLETIIASKQIKDALAKKLWLQVEDARQRNRLHYEILKIAKDRGLTQDFVLEMTQFGTIEERTQAEELLSYRDAERAP